MGERRLNKEGAGLPAPQGGIKRYFFLLGTHFSKFIGLNLLFLLFALPIITLPAGLAALNRVCIKLIREGNCFLWDDFFEEFKRSFAPSLPLGLLFGGALLSAYYLMSLGITNGGSIFGMLFLAAGLFLAAFALLRGSWTFVLLSMLPLKNRALLKNARILSLQESGRSAAMLLSLAAAFAFSLLFFPLSAILLALLLFSALQYTLCFFVNGAVQKRILDPYNKQQEEKNHEG